MLSERRASPRVSLLEYSGIILVDVPSLCTTGLLVDLSEDGLGVQFAAPTPDVATVDVGFPLGQKQVIGTCDAIWSTPTTRGLRFRDLLPEVRAEIHSWLQGLSGKNQRASDVDVTDCEARPSWQEAVGALIAGNEPWESGVPLELGAPGNKIDDVPVPTGSSDRNSHVIEESRTSNANEPGAQPPIRARVGASGRLSNRTVPEWAIRIATRRQQDLVDHLTGLGDGQKLARGVQRAPAGQPADRHASEDLLVPGALDENIRAKSPAEAVSARGLQPGLSEEISRSVDARPRASFHYRQHLRGTHWAIVSIFMVVGVLVLWHFHGNGDRSAPGMDTATRLLTSQAGAAETLQRPAVGIIEVIQGKPIVHSDARPKRRPEPISGGGVVVREMPTYDDAALASGLQGDVHAVLTISEGGVVQEVRITRGNSLLAEQVMNAAAHWRFAPFFEHFGAISVELPVTFRFHIMTAAGVQSRKPRRSN